MLIRTRRTNRHMKKKPKQLTNSPKDYKNLCTSKHFCLQMVVLSRHLFIATLLLFEDLNQCSMFSVHVVLAPFLITGR